MDERSPFALIRISSRVARWFVFKPKIPIWVNFGGPCNGKCCYIGSILRQLETFYCHLVYSVVIWYIFPCFGILYLEKSGNPDQFGKHLKCWLPSQISHHESKTSDTPRADVTIFSPKNSAKKFAFSTQNKAKLCKILIITLVFENSAKCFRRKLLKIAENWDHNIDPSFFFKNITPTYIGM
jgi:hypothetical protein